MDDLGGEPSPATVERLRELGIQSVVYTPCANRPAAAICSPS